VVESGCSMFVDIPKLPKEGSLLGEGSTGFTVESGDILSISLNPEDADEQDESEDDGDKIFAMK